MNAESLAFRTARRHVRDYADESTDLMQRHAEAIDCRDCEAFLQLGIDAFNWLTRADQTIRDVIYRGKSEFDPNLDVALASLYAEWLKPREYAEKWIATEQDRGFQVENFDVFQSCLKEVRAIVEANESALQNDAFVELRDEAIEAHRNGETLEFWEK